MNVQTYISGLVEVPTGVKTLADLITFNSAHAEEELVAPFWTDQSTCVGSVTSMLFMSLTVVDCLVLLHLRQEKPTKRTSMR